MKILILLSAVTLSGCTLLPSSGDPLGSPAKGVKGEADYKVVSGVICREGSGNADYRGTDGSIAGARILYVGEEKDEGCFRCEGRGYEYESAACNGKE